MKNIDRHGFTLIELSLVLVIIGLLIGGVLAGRELIRAAEVRATIKQVEQIQIAVITFQLKYACLPGDCANASTLGFKSVWDAYTPGESPNGNGDGKIWRGGVSVYEYVQAWYQLYVSGLVKGGSMTPDGYFIDLAMPARNFDRPGGWGTGQAYWYVGWLEGDGRPESFIISSGHYLWTLTGFGNDSGDAVMTPEEAFGIDSKIDDGAPRTGKVMADGSDEYHGMLTGGLQDWAAGPAGATSNVCVTNDSVEPQYNVANVSRNSQSLCSLAIQAAF